MSQEMVKEKISQRGKEDFVSEVRGKSLARKVVINGRSLVDEQGAMILAEDVNFDSVSNEDTANIVVKEWGVLL